MDPRKDDDQTLLTKTMAPPSFRPGQGGIERPNRRNIDFVANISHELRTPMNAVIGMVEVALKEQLSPTVRRYLQTAKESADVLLRLLNDILDFSKMDAGGFVLECEPLSLRTLLDDTTSTFAAQAYQKGLELACRVSADVPDGLVGDPQRLRQVLANLVGNALKFTKRGEVVIRVTVESRTAEEVCLWFSVTDTGIGISPQDQERIFAPFIQADASTTRLYGGTGLGLAIVSELVSMMGGRLWVESELGVGSSFHFTTRFPLQHGLAPSIHDREIPLDRLRGVDVLVLCSNTTNRRLMEEALVSWGMNPVAVNSGEAALAQLERAEAEKREFPLVIVDPLLGDDDGFALAAEIQRRPGWGGGTILVMSPGEREMLSERCRGLKIAAQLDKPILQSGLLDAVLTALSDRRSEPTEDRHGRQERGPEPRSLRILVAEDVPANQEVIKTILAGRGHSVRGVMNGRDAVEWFMREAYEVILMDVQMPEVDGLQATRMIRSLEVQTGSHVPILALTAHALNGDRERCLEAGMDDHISKPIDVGEVIRLVERYGTRKEKTDVEGGRAEAPRSMPNERDRPDAEPVFYPQVALSRLRGSFRLLQDLARLFFRDSQDLVEQLHRGIAAGDAQEVERVAHSLKGLAANFEAREAVAAARRVEQLGHAGDLAAASPAADKLEHEIMRLKEALATECDVSEA